MKIHPFANLFPMCSDEEIQLLADDIEKHGLRQPIVIDSDEMILDGRNRAAACGIAQVQPLYEPFVGTDAEKLAYVVSANVKRRHLSTSERADIAVKIATMNLGDNQHSTKKQGGSNEPTSKKVSTKQAATLLNVSSSSVKRAKARTSAEESGNAKAATKPDETTAHEVMAETTSLSSKECKTNTKHDHSPAAQARRIKNMFQQHIDKAVRLADDLHRVKPNHAVRITVVKALQEAKLW